MFLIEIILVLFFFAHMFLLSDSSCKTLNLVIGDIELTPIQTLFIACWGIGCTIILVWAWSTLFLWNEPASFYCRGFVITCHGCVKVLYFVLRFYGWHLLVMAGVHQYLFTIFAELLSRYPQQRARIHSLFWIAQLFLLFGFILLDVQLGLVFNKPRCTTGLALGISFFLF